MADEFALAPATVTAVILPVATHTVLMIGSRLATFEMLEQLEILEWSELEPFAQVHPPKGNWFAVGVARRGRQLARAEPPDDDFDIYIDWKGEIRKLEAKQAETGLTEEEQTKLGRYRYYVDVELPRLQQYERDAAKAFDALPLAIVVS